MQGLIVWTSVLLATALVASAQKDYIDPSGNFVDARDQKMVDFRLQNFAKECTFVSSYEAKLMTNFDEISKNLEENSKKGAMRCYQESLPKMRSVRFLYDRLCRSLNYESRVTTKNQYFKQFVAVSEYQDGISLLHIILNDCLQATAASANEIVSATMTAASSTGLIQGLKDIDSKLPFLSNNKEIR